MLHVLEQYYKACATISHARLSLDDLFGIPDDDGPIITVPTSYVKAPIIEIFEYLGVDFNWEARFSEFDSGF